MSRLDEIVSRAQKTQNHLSYLLNVVKKLKSEHPEIFKRSSKIATAMCEFYTLTRTIPIDVISIYAKITSKTESIKSSFKRYAKCIRNDPPSSRDLAVALSRVCNSICEFKSNHRELSEHLKINVNSTNLMRQVIIPSFPRTPNAVESISVEVAIRRMKRSGAMLSLELFEKFNENEQITLIEHDSRLISYLPTEKIIKLLMRWPMAIQYIPPEFQTEDMCNLCIRETGWALQYCNKGLINGELERIAVQQTPDAIQWCNPLFAKYDELCEIAIQGDSHCIEFIEDPSPKLRLLALQRDWTCYELLTAPLNEEESMIVDEGKRRKEENKSNFIVIEL
jgi:hypothetical protein